jgi:hypothetical protein
MHDIDVCRHVDKVFPWKFALPFFQLDVHHVAAKTTHFMATMLLKQGFLHHLLTSDLQCNPTQEASFEQCLSQR